MEHWSVEDYKNYTDRNYKKAKYRANKTSVDGHTFDSQILKILVLHFVNGTSYTIHW